MSSFSYIIFLYTFHLSLVTKSSKQERKCEKFKKQKQLTGENALSSKLEERERKGESFIVGAKASQLWSPVEVGFFLTN